MEPEAIVRMLAELSSAQAAELFNQGLGGFDRTLGMVFLEVGVDRVVATLHVSEAHAQPYGLVHGGVYCTLAESVCSVGAALSVLAEGRHAVGVENRTRFLRPARPGCVLTVRGSPLRVEGAERVWQAGVEDAEGRTCARSEVRVRVLEHGRVLAGQQVGLAAASDDAAP